MQPVKTLCKKNRGGWENGFQNREMGDAPKPPRKTLNAFESGFKKLFRRLSDEKIDTALTSVQ